MELRGLQLDLTYVLSPELVGEKNASFEKLKLGVDENDLAFNNNHFKCAYEESLKVRLKLLNKDFCQLFNRA